MVQHLQHARRMPFTALWHGSRTRCILRRYTPGVSGEAVPEGRFITCSLPAALHQGRLANLSGIETGDYPVDVIFSRPGDALLQR